MRFLKHYVFGYFGVLICCFAFIEIGSNKPIVGFGLIMFGCTLMICQFLKDIVFEMVSRGAVEDVKTRAKWGTWSHKTMTKKELKKIYPDKR
jgi:hypothetical protein